MKKIGIIAPMPSEIEFVISKMNIHRAVNIAMRTFYEGDIAGKVCVVALSRIGKVASSTTASIMIDQFGVDAILLTGVAGSLNHHVNIGDVVIANSCVQHDMDCSPLFPQLEIPLLDKTYFECDPYLISLANACFSNMFNIGISQFLDFTELSKLNITSPTIHTGMIASGDQFISNESQLIKITTDLPGVLAVEMEGGAVGQVCYEWGVPYINIRSISDNADHKASVDFNAYIENVAKHYTWQLVRFYCEQF